MTRSDIMKRLSKALRHRDIVLPIPEDSDWMRLESQFGCKFPETFVVFMELMAEYEMTLEVYSVVELDDEQKELYDNGSLLEAYRMEISWNQPQYEWPLEMIPFANIGNGDVFCLSSKDIPMKVFCIEHGQRIAEELAPDFDTWLRTRKF